MFYVKVLDRLCKRIDCVRPEMWRDRRIFLLHYPHTATIVQQFFAQKGVTQLSHLDAIFKPPLPFRFRKIKIGVER